MYSVKCNVRTLCLMDMKNIFVPKHLLEKVSFARFKSTIVLNMVENSGCLDAKRELN